MNRDGMTRDVGGKPGKTGVSEIKRIFSRKRKQQTVVNGIKNKTRTKIVFLGFHNNKIKDDWRGQHLPCSSL